MFRTSTMKRCSWRVAHSIRSLTAQTCGCWTMRKEIRPTRCWMVAAWDLRNPGTYAGMDPTAVEAQLAKAAAAAKTGNFNGQLLFLGTYQNQVAAPEPGTLMMFGSGIIVLAGMLRRKINL